MWVRVVEVMILWGPEVDLCEIKTFDLKMVHRDERVGGYECMVLIYLCVV